jgi:hypothetical protein
MVREHLSEPVEVMGIERLVPLLEGLPTVTAIETPSAGEV